MELAALILSSSGLAAIAVKLIEVLYDAFSRRRKTQRRAEDERRKCEQECREEIRDTLETLKTELEENKEDTVALMHDRIYQTFCRLNAQDSISVEDKANLDYLWQRYKARGGNHKAEVLYDVIDRIPVKAETEVRG